MMTVYLAGPMRSYPQLNYEAFASAQKRLAHMGYNVLNPHTLDRVAGFDSTKDCVIDHNGTPEGFDIKACIRRDVEAILRSDMIIMLDGWEDSTGAKAEHAIAEWLNLPIGYYRNT